MPDKKVKIIHIEDNNKWQEEIRDTILLGTKDVFREEDIISCSDLEAAKLEMGKLKCPLILIIDLQLISHKDSNSCVFSGLEWIVGEMRDFNSEKADMVVFVVSAHVGLSENKLVLDTIVNNGVSKENIFRKDKFDSNKFLMNIVKTAKEIKKIARDNVLNNKSSQKIDPYLTEQIQGSLDPVDGADLKESMFFPMIIETKQKKWNYKDIPDIRDVKCTGNIYRCKGTSRTLLALQEDSEVERVEGNRSSENLDHIDCLADKKPHLKLPNIIEKGNMAIIGIIDSDIDVLHKAFLNSNGDTAIISVWDQNGPGPAPKGKKYTYGAEYTRKDINRFFRNPILVPNALSSMSVKNGHGTHVASIAAGRKINKFPGGVAPCAGIVVVISSLHLNNTSSIMEAVEYIKDIAKKEKKPVVINISQGMNLGAHDGTSLLERHFNIITNYGEENGITIVKSAGNERNRNIHAQLEMKSYTKGGLIWSSEVDRMNVDRIELWFNSEDTFKFRIKDPVGNYSNWVDTTSYYANGNFKDQNQYQMTYTRYCKPNRSSQLYVSINRGDAPTILLGNWILEIESGIVKGNGIIHAWIERSEKHHIKFVNHIDERVTLNMPGTAKHIITVGSLIKDNIFKASAFSGFGPTRDGRLKPECGICGEGVLGAKHNSGYKCREGAGTSFAAPQISGLIALAFSKQAKKIIKNPAVKQLNTRQICKALIEMYPYPYQHPMKGKKNDQFNIGIFFKLLGL